MQLVWYARKDFDPLYIEPTYFSSRAVLWVFRCCCGCVMVGGKGWVIDWVGLFRVLGWSVLFGEFLLVLAWRRGICLVCSRIFWSFAVLHGNYWEALALAICASENSGIRIIGELLWRRRKRRSLPNKAQSFPLWVQMSDFWSSSWFGKDVPPG